MISIHLILKILTLAAIVCAAGLWVGSGVNTRPRYRDKQTLIGGMIWSQAIIHIGLTISLVVNEVLNLYVHAYFLISGVLLCFITGAVLLLNEFKSMKRSPSRSQSRMLDGEGKTVHVRFASRSKYDKLYVAIGILGLIAGALTLATFILLIV